MKKIQFTHADLSDSKLITEICSGAKIYHRPPISFALASPENDGIYFGFESISLARILEDIETKIYDVRVVEVNVKVGFRSGRQAEIHLSVGIGKHIIITSNERVFLNEQSYASIPEKETGTLCSPDEAWGLSMKGYRGHIRLTKRMAAYIDILANHQRQDHILHMMWREYQLEQRKPVEPLNPTIIDGEFITFTAFTRHDEIVVFDYA